jgi:predicted negative regulator of RcsB-dependent stress response
MGRIRIQNLDRLDEVKEAQAGVRETIIWILFCFILAAGAFGWGYIYKDHRVDDLREQVHRLDDKQKDMNGRLIAVEGRAPRGMHGSGERK